MRISFEGFEYPIDIEPGNPTVIEIENCALFTRVCTSIKSGEGRYATEPYTLWDGDIELNPAGSFLFIDSPLALPWDDRSMTTEMTRRFEKAFLEDEELRSQVDQAAALITSQFSSLGMNMHAGYAFANEWDIRKFIKSFAFGVDLSNQESLLESLTDFLSLALDSACKRVLTFVNLKTFLTKNELESLYKHAFFSKSQLLLLENKVDLDHHTYEVKHGIDLLFLESRMTLFQSEDHL